MKTFEELNFETVDITEIPPTTWGVNYWRKPITIEFLLELEKLPDAKAFRLTMASRKEIQDAHSMIRHRLERATKLGLLKQKYTITSRKSWDGEFHLFIYRELA